MSTNPEDDAKVSVVARRRWLLGLEPIFEGGWLHKGKRAHRWDVEGALVAVSLLGDVTVDLAEARSTPAEISLDAWAIFRDVDVFVPEGTDVTLSGRVGNSHLHNEVLAVSGEGRHRVMRIRGHTLLGDVTVRMGEQNR